MDMYSAYSLIVVLVIFSLPPSLSLPLVDENVSITLLLTRAVCVCYVMYVFLCDLSFSLLQMVKEFAWDRAGTSRLSDPKKQDRTRAELLWGSLEFLSG